MNEHATLRRTALVLVAAGLAWNLVEAVVAFWAGVQAGSVALLAFGLDSVVELFAGGVLVWRLLQDEGGDDDETAENRARRLIALTFFVLAAYVGIHSIATLSGWIPRPEPSLVGVAIAVASMVVMSVLYVAKMRIAVRMQSRSLRAEAMESLFCDLQDVAVLVGLGFNAWLAWWWADPVAALALVPFFIKEGMENLSGEHEHGDDEHHDHDEDVEPAAARLVCFCLNCLYGLRACWAACCRA